MAYLLSGGMVFACACCAERGERFERPQGMGEYERTELAGLRAAGPAQIFVTACGLDCVKGIENPVNAYPAELSIAEGHIRIALGASHVSLPVPGQGTRFGVDVAPFENVTTPQFYSELRLTGLLSASGDFAAAAGAEAEFVLSGWGNACLMGQDFSHWSLEVAADGVEFRLFGQLGSK